MGTAWPTPVRPRESRQETSISKREALRQRVVGDWAHGAADSVAANSREPAMDMRIRHMGGLLPPTRAGLGPGGSFRPTKKAPPATGPWSEGVRSSPVRRRVRDEVPGPGLLEAEGLHQ